MMRPLVVKGLRAKINPQKKSILLEKSEDLIWPSLKQKREVNLTVNAELEAENDCELDEDIDQTVRISWIHSYSFLYCIYYVLV